jgi:serine/threonine protein kinase
MRMSSRLANRKLGEQDIVSLTKRLALALSAAHGAGVIHRGLRPHAIALPQGRLSDATITDFNLIKAAHSGLSPAFDNAMVDHDYCAPEQLSNSGEGAVVGPWTDVYSLALVILSALGGKQSEAERKANPDLSHLPRKLRPVFERMLEPRPARRLQSMDEVVKQLDVALESAPLQMLLNRAQAIRLPDFRRPARESVTPEARQVLPAPPAKTAPRVAAPPPKAPALARASLPPLPESLQPAKTVPLGKFHGPQTSMGFGGMARRGAVALSALLLAATPWIIQTSLPRGPAEASTAPPSAQVQMASKANQAARAAAALPKGRVYGADNTNSRVTLRFHRPTRVTVHARGQRLLFSRAVQPGDTYRTPTLPDLTVSTEDGHAVEVLFNGTSAGFVGEDGAPVVKSSLTQLASLAPLPAAPPSKQTNQSAVAKEVPAPSVTIPEFTVEVVPAPDAATDEPAGSDVAAPVDTVAPAIASREPASPPADAVATQAAPEPPPVPAQETPAPPEAVVQTPVDAAPEQQAVIAPPPAPESEARRPLLDRLLPWRANRPAVAADESAALILSPAITKDAADRAKAAADKARAARDAAQQKAREETRRREGSFFNSTLGINSPY